MLCRAGSHFYLLVYACFTQLLLAIVHGVVVVLLLDLRVVFVAWLCGSIVVIFSILKKEKKKIALLPRW
jgi:hypothetical protein